MYVKSKNDNSLRWKKITKTPGLLNLTLNKREKKRYGGQLNLRNAELKQIDRFFIFYNKIFQPLMCSS